MAQQSFWGNLLSNQEETEEEKKKKKRAQVPATPGSFWSKVEQVQPTVPPTPGKPKKSFIKKAWGVTGRPAMNALEFVGKGMAGATLFPQLRTAENIIETIQGKGKGVGHYLKDLLPIPYVGREVWGPDVLKKAGAGGWLQKVFAGMAGQGALGTALEVAALYGATSPEAANRVAGMGIDVAADPATYMSFGLTKAGTVAKLIDKAAEGSKIARQAAKLSKAGKLLPYGETLAERMRAGQEGFKFMGKIVAPSAQGAVMEKLAPVGKALMESKAGALLSTKGGSPELRAIREIINEELRGRPDLTEQIMAQFGKRKAFVEGLAKRTGFDKNQVEQVLTHLTEVKPPADAPAYLGVQYQKIEDALDPTILSTLRADPEVEQFTKEIRKVMTDISDVEMQAGVLRNIFETDVLDYLTHLLTPEGGNVVRRYIRKGGDKNLIRKMLGLINPSDQPRKLLVPAEDISYIPEDLIKGGGKGGAVAKGGKATATTAPAAPATPGLNLIEQGTDIPTRQVTRPYLMQDFKSRAKGLSQSIFSLHNKPESEGATANLWMGNMVEVAKKTKKDIWSVSIFPDRTQRFHGKAIPRADIHKYIMDNADLLRDPRLSVGIWFDKKSGVTYLDVVVTIDDYDTAFALGKRYNQKAIFNLKTFQEVPTGGTGIALPGMPPVMARLHDFHPDSGKRLTLYHFSEHLKPGADEVSPQYMGRALGGEEMRTQFENAAEPLKGRMKKGNLPKANFYAEGRNKWEAHLWGNSRLYQVDVDPSDLLIIGQEGIEGDPDILAAQAGKIGWYSEKYKQARIITPIQVKEISKDTLKGKKSLPHMPKGIGPEELARMQAQGVGGPPISLRDPKTGTIYPPEPGEVGHPQIEARLKAAGIDTTGFEPGWVQEDGKQFFLARTRPNATTGVEVGKPGAIAYGTATPAYRDASGAEWIVTGRSGGYVRLKSADGKTLKSVRADVLDTEYKSLLNEPVVGGPVAPAPVNQAQAARTQLALGQQPTAPPAAPAAPAGGGIPYMPKTPTGFVPMTADDLMKMLPGMAWKDKKRLIDAGILKYPAISEANQLAREGKLFPGVKVDQLFYEDPAKITALRQMRSNKALMSARVLDTARKRGLEEGWAIPLEKGKGIPLGYDMVRSPFTTDVAFQSDVANALNGMHSLLQSPNEMKGVLRAYMKGLQFWKVWTLMPFPSYHFRNVFGGNLFNQALAGMNPVKEGWWNINGANAIAHRVQRVNVAKNSIMLGETAKPKSLRQAQEVLTTATGMKYTLSEIDDLARKFNLYRGGQFTGDIFDEARSLSKFKKGVDKATYNALTEAGMKLGARLEDNAKVGVFVYYLRQGSEPIEAAKMAERFIFDYFDIPPLIQKSKAIMPFVTWYYKNIPLQLEYMVKKPYVFQSIYKTKMDISAGKEPHPAVVTPYYKESYPVVIGKKGDKATWLSLARWFPVADVNMLTDPLRAGFSMLYPLVKAPVEIAANKDVYFNQPLNEVEKRVNFLGMYMSPKAAYVGRQFRPLSWLDQLNALGMFGTEKHKGIFGQKREGKFEPSMGARLARAVTGIRTYETDVPRAVASKINQLTRETSLLRSRLKYQVDEKEKERLKGAIMERQAQIRELRAYRYNREGQH